MAKKPSTKSMDAELTLSQLIEHAASEIRIAAEKAKNEGAKPVMVFSGCELEVEATVSAKMEGGIAALIFKIGGNTGGGNATKIKLSFGPVAGAAAAFQGTSKKRLPAGAVEEEK